LYIFLFLPFPSSFYVFLFFFFFPLSSFCPLFFLFFCLLFKGRRLLKFSFVFPPAPPSSFFFSPLPFLSLFLSSSRFLPLHPPLLPLTVVLARRLKCLLSPFYLRYPPLHFSLSFFFLFFPTLFRRSTCLPLRQFLYVKLSLVLLLRLSFLPLFFCSSCFFFYSSFPFSLLHLQAFRDILILTHSRYFLWFFTSRFPHSSRFQLTDLLYLFVDFPFISLPSVHYSVPPVFSVPHSGRADYTFPSINLFSILF